jgi:hypothetical protein
LVEAFFGEAEGEADVSSVVVVFFLVVDDVEAAPVSVFFLVVDDVALAVPDFLVVAVFLVVAAVLEVAVVSCLLAQAVTNASATRTVITDRTDFFIRCG